MSTNNVSKQRSRVVKRVIPKIAEARNTTPKALLEHLYAKHGNQIGIAQELGVSQGTVSLEMLRQGLFK